MSHKDYRNYSKSYQQPQNAEPAVEPDNAAHDAHTHTEESETVKTIDATVPVPDEIVETTTVEAAPELPTAVTGVVSGCKKLNVRNRPTTTAAIITVVEEGTEVVIAQPVLDGEFYKVTLANGTTGYCMKKFITVK